MKSWPLKLIPSTPGRADWVATDSTNKNGPGTRYTDPNYNGVNYYGGATSVDINPFLQGALAQNPALAPINKPFAVKTKLCGPNRLSRIRLSG